MLQTSEKNSLQVQALKAILTLKIHYRNVPCSEFHELISEYNELLEKIHSSEKYCSNGNDRVNAKHQEPDATFGWGPMAGLYEGGNEPPGSLKVISVADPQYCVAQGMFGLRDNREQSEPVPLNHDSSASLFVMLYLELRWNKLELETLTWMDGEAWKLKSLECGHE
ncbi:hypothetical protein ANN_15584 [Periplaneta americana]|uniref:Uncharacterized protein n=1 Tax=Periplaneta americana TaxID=6978 RepID=A0ABQ8SHS1_PERAM|nr:hypothetical protein ANN_15584 [Periplaneta americana]